MSNRLSVFQWVSPAVIALLAAGCATTPAPEGKDPKALLEQACSIGKDLQSVKGSLWMNAKSKDASGRFPAIADATPDSLNLEVTNLVGGREAMISVKGSEYTIEHQGRIQRGSNSWGGIPLRWATELFMGRVPCPKMTAASGARVVMNDSDELIVERVSPAMAEETERYVYRFGQWSGKPWPQYVKWELKGSKPVSVEFSFESPDDKTGLARIWSAKSSNGEVKVRWKERETR